MNAYLAIALPLVMALVAAGAVLFLKIARRRGASGARGIGDAVPARPLSSVDARRMKRRYFWTAGTLLAVIGLAGLLVAA